MHKIGASHEIKLLVLFGCTEVVAFTGVACFVSAMIFVFSF